MLGSAAALVIGLIVWFVLYQQSQKQINASQALSSVFATQLTSGARAENPDGFLQIAAKYPHSSAAERALLLAASSLFSQGKSPEAQAQFDKFVREHRESPLIAEAQLGIAACLDAQGKTDQAIAAYKQVVERHPTENVIPQAKFSLARLYEAQNKPDQAYKLYEDVARDPYGSLGSEAGMRLEELKLKHPNLAATTPTAPPASKTLPLKVQPAKK